MSKVLAVKNWSKFQHYKHRCPPWIKLAADTFQNHEFSCLQDASKLLAVCIWTLASRTQDGTVPDNFEYIKRWGFLGDTVEPKHLSELVEQGFVIRASGLLATCVQSADSETETETETETEKKEPSVVQTANNGDKPKQEFFDLERKRQELIKARSMR